MKYNFKVKKRDGVWWVHLGDVCVATVVDVTKLDYCYVLTDFPILNKSRNYASPEGAYRAVKRGMTSLLKFMGLEFYGGKTCR